MHSTVIIGIDLDEPEQARDALALGAWLAAGDRLTLATVLDRASGKQRCRRALAALAADFATAPDLMALEGSSPAGALHALSDRLRPRAVVVGSARETAAGAVSPGPVGELLLNGGGAPVAVAPSGFRVATGRRPTVGVGFGGTPESEDAVRAGADIAARTGAELRVLTVPERHPTPAAAAVALERALASTTATAECVRLDGDPADALAAASRGLDLLVAGSRSYGPLGAVLLGAVTRRLIHTARCPVMVVPRTRDAALAVALVGGMEASVEA